MRIRSFFRTAATASVAALTLVACGDDNTNTPATDTVGSDSTIGVDGALPPDTSGEDTVVGDDTVAPDDAVETPDGADDVTGEDAVVEPAVFTAEVTLDGTTETVEPAVRRGLSWAARSIDKSLNVALGEPFNFECAPSVSALEGGRDIAVDSIGIAGNFNSICGSNLARIDAAEGSLKTNAAVACNNKNTCSYNAEESFNTLLAECEPTNVRLTADYRCVALTPSPAFVFEATVGGNAVRVEGLDAMGDFNCYDRSVGIYYNMQLTTIADDAPCNINITRRTDNTLGGTITATVVDPNGARHTIAAEFRHDDTTARSLVGLNTGTDLCVSTELTHTVETVGDDTVDVFQSGALGCQVNTSQTLDPIGFRRIRPRAGSNRTFACGDAIDVTRGDASTASDLGGWCRTAAAASDGDGVLRYVFYDVTTCATGNVCATPLPIVYLQYDLDTSN